VTEPATYEATAEDAVADADAHAILQGGLSPQDDQAAARPARRTCLLVLGMHRSGTSALTRVLSLMGAALPTNLLGANEGNQTGHWEPERLIQLHDRMLAEAGSRWDDWRAFDTASLPDDRRQHYRDEIARIVTEEYGEAPLIVLKEPRISRFVPLYAEILADLGFDVRYVLMLRNPLAVAASLAQRNGFTPAFSMLLWLRHELEAEKATRGKPRALISYDGFVEDWRTAMTRIVEALPIEWPRVAAEAEAGAYVSDRYRHHRAGDEIHNLDPGIANWLKDTYRALGMLEKNGGDRLATDMLDRVKSDFDAAASTFGNAFFAELAARERVLTDEAARRQRLAEDRATEIS
jgi:hypothetical protein